MGEPILKRRRMSHLKRARTYGLTCHTHQSAPRASNEVNP
jgi:hypothetical protein